jgi:hypothetical protein
VPVKAFTVALVFGLWSLVFGLWSLVCGGANEQFLGHYMTLMQMVSPSRNSCNSSTVARDVDVISCTFSTFETRRTCTDLTTWERKRWVRIRVDHPYQNALYKSRQDKTSQTKPSQDKTSQDKTRQDKTRQDKTRQDKTRQDKTQDQNKDKVRRSQAEISQYKPK